MHVEKHPTYPNEFYITDDEGRRRRVAVKEGGTEEDAIAVMFPPSAERQAAINARAREARVKAENRRRIYAVASERAQSNINAAAAAGLLSPDQLVAYQRHVRWIAEMRAACQRLAENPDLNLADEANWPACPQEVVALAAAH
jgi:competence protein ComGC